MVKFEPINIERKYVVCYQAFPTLGIGQSVYGFFTADHPSDTNELLKMAQEQVAKSKHSAQGEKYNVLFTSVSDIAVTS